MVVSASIEVTLNEELYSQFSNDHSGNDAKQQQPRSFLITPSLRLPYRDILLLSERLLVISLYLLLPQSHISIRDLGALRWTSS